MGVDDGVVAAHWSGWVGFTLLDHTPDLIEHTPDHVWAPVLDAHGEIRKGAWVAKLTDLLNLTGRPTGMPVIVREERPHPGAQLRITDIDGHRITAPRIRGTATERRRRRRRRRRRI